MYKIVFLFKLLNNCVCVYSPELSSWDFNDYCLIGLAQFQLQPLLFVFQYIFLLFVFQMHFTPHFRCKSSSSRRSGAKVSYVFIGVNAFLHIYQIAQEYFGENLLQFWIWKAEQIEAADKSLGGSPVTQKSQLSRVHSGGRRAKTQRPQHKNDGNLRFWNISNFAALVHFIFWCLYFQQWDKLMMKRLSVAPNP